MSPPDYPSAWLRPRSAASVSPGRVTVALLRPVRPISGWRRSEAIRRLTEMWIDTVCRLLKTEEKAGRGPNFKEKLSGHTVSIQQ